MEVLLFKFFDRENVVLFVLVFFFSVSFGVNVGILIVVVKI